MSDYTVEERERATLDVCKLDSPEEFPFDGTREQLAGWLEDFSLPSHAVATQIAIDLQCLANRQAAEIERLRGRVEEAYRKVRYARFTASNHQCHAYLDDAMEIFSVSDSQGVEG